MVVTVTNGKGGTGKTTVSVLLALAVTEAGRKVAIWDRDPQGTASRWIATQGHHGGLVLYQPGTAYDVVIVDTPPRLESAAVHAAIAEADKVLLVASPSPADLWVSQSSAAEIKRHLGAKRPARVVFNSVQAGTLLEKELGNVSDKIGIAALSSVIRRRQCYQHAAILGWSGLTAAAKEEVMRLAGEVVAL